MTVKKKKEHPDGLSQKPKSWDDFFASLVRVTVELKDRNYFQQVRVAFGAVEWPHEQDFSKDTLYLLSTPVLSQSG